MIIVRTPFRVSFFGGGTDYPAWYEKNGGSVLSASINKYCYITVRHLPPFFEHKTRIVWSKIELINHINEIQHPTVSAIIKFLNLGDSGLEIHHEGDLPARSGLGSSSSFAVGLLHALYALNGKLITKHELALNAIYVEQKIMKENVGSQDQVIVSYGGFNRIDFGDLNKVIVSPITITEQRLNLFQQHIMLFFTGLARNASEIAGEQIRNITKKEVELKTMQQMVDEAIKILANNNGESFDDFGKLLDENWKLKKSLSSQISSPYIDEIYKKGIEAGALGGKILGAGSGGFILFFTKPDKQEKIKKALKNFLYVPVKFDYLGSQIIHYDQTNNF